jgi:hypothetical protein
MLGCREGDKFIGFAIRLLDHPRLGNNPRAHLDTIRGAHEDVGIFLGYNRLSALCLAKTVGSLKLNSSIVTQDTLQA